MTSGHPRGKTHKKITQEKPEGPLFLGYEKVMRNSHKLGLIVRKNDKVDHKKLLEVLGKLEIFGKDIRIIQNLYWKKTACKRIEKRFSKCTNMGFLPDWRVERDIYRHYRMVGVAKRTELRSMT